MTIALILLGLALAQPVQGGMLWGEPYRGPWIGHYACYVRSDATAPQTIWPEIMEADTDALVASASACVDVPPGGGCNAITDNPAGRRCRAQWSGTGTVTIIGHATGNAHSEKVEARKHAVRQRLGLE